MAISFKGAHFSQDIMSIGKARSTLSPHVGQKKHIPSDLVVD
jgi:hypothetical protein